MNYINSGANIGDCWLLTGFYYSDATGIYINCASVFDAVGAGFTNNL
jgi:hypothetical protein